MKMSNITFEVLGQTVAFLKSAEKKNIFTIIFLIRIRLKYCWLSVTDGSPALHQHWANLSCYLGNGLYGVERSNASPT